jgi:hypothetical protein
MRQKLAMCGMPDTHKATHTHRHTHAYIHACIHSRMRTQVYTYTHAHKHMHTNTRIHVYTHTHTHTHTYTHEHTHIHTHRVFAIIKLLKEFGLTPRIFNTGQYASLLSSLYSLISAYCSLLSALSSLLSSLSSLLFALSYPCSCLLSIVEMDSKLLRLRAFCVSVCMCVRHSYVCLADTKTHNHTLRYILPSSPIVEVQTHTHTYTQTHTHTRTRICTHS